MKKTFGEYQHLAGNTFTRGSLWEGKDHLLYVDSKGVPLAFRESCRRIDYKNIQAVMIGHSRVWYLTLILQFALILLASSAAYSGFRIMLSRPENQTQVLAAFLSIPALVALFPIFAINLVKGPTCVCKLQTAVQVITLRPVNRIRRGRKTAARITELCRSHQSPTESDLGAIVSAADEQPAIYVKRKFTGSAPMLWGLVLLLAGGGLAIGELFVDSKVYLIADLVVNGLASLLLIVALIRSAKIELPETLRGIVWAVTGNAVCATALWFCLYITAVTTVTFELIKQNRPPRVGNDLMPEVIQWLSSASLADLPTGGQLLLLSGAVSVLLSLLGLPSVLRTSTARQTPTTVSP